MVIRQAKRLFSLLFLGIPQVVLYAQAEPTLSPETKLPYPPSEVIREVIYNWPTQNRLAPGSDNWAITWAADDHQYAAWGDGGGFDGTDSEGRVSLGVARIEGDWFGHTAVNVWGGMNAANEAQFEGKSYGIISIKDTLYMWVSPYSGPDNYKEARLSYSADRGASWTQADWAFTQDEALVLPTILQFGKEYDGARDDYVYHYAIRLKDASDLKIQIPGEIDLIRVPQDHLLERDAYEFFAGLDSSGDPIWTADIEARKPVFEDANGVGWTVSVSYNAGLKRYLLITEHDESFAGNMGIFDAPEPWGPWTTVGYYNNWGGTEETFFWNFSNKWLSEDGLEFTLIYTGIGEHDSWHLVRGRFIPHE